MSTAIHPERRAHSADSSSLCNIASYLGQLARKFPSQPALVLQPSSSRNRAVEYESLTFRQLESLSSRYANGLSNIGIGRNMRVLVMIRPGFEFVGVVFALFKMGTVPVMIDPGMGARRMLDCLRSVDLHGFVGIPLAHVMRVLRPGSFKTVRHVVTVGRRWFWGGATLKALADRAGDDYSVVDTRREDVAAILFTSGSTGPPKGVVYEHGMFDAQVKEIQRQYGIEPGEVDLPAFPLFALFSVAMGMTAVIPDMDPSHPVRVNPARIVEAIQRQKVTNTFGSPAIWKRVAHYCVKRGIKLPTLRRVLIAGAPVPYTVIEQLHRILSESADVHTPYGATESLPVSSISGRAVVAHCRARTRVGGGTCVGKPCAEMTLCIIRITDQPIPVWSDDLVVPDGEIGEIVVSGPVVTKEYFGLPDDTALTKIRDGHRVWHRMGDVGYRDEARHIWFCGRKAHRVVTEAETLFSVPCEAIFNEHPDIYRSALVGIGPLGRQTPVIVVEPEPDRFPRGSRARAFREELLERSRTHELTRAIEIVLFRRGFPVDIRHNVKIDREALAEWAAERLR